MFLQRGGMEVDACTKILNKPGMQKTCVPELRILSDLKNYLQNILERKLCNCLGQLLLIYYKNVKNKIECDIDSANGICIH